MKKVSIAVIAALAVVPCIAMGQGPGGGRMGGGFDPAKMQQMRAQRQKEMRLRLIKDLKLSVTQIKSYDVLVKKENDARDKMMKGMFPGGKPPTGGPGGAKPDFSAMKAKMDKMRAEHDASMKKILNAGQFTKYQAIEKEMRAQRMGGGGPGGKPGGPGH